jgi:hypothetical protein
MKFAKWVFTLGGIWGVLIIAPLFFLEDAMAKASQPFTHPDMFYGFVASTLSLQFMYLLIGRDPARYRPMMLVGVFGKLAYTASLWTLFGAGRIPIIVPAVAAPDLLLAVLFIVSWFRTHPKT